MMAKFVEVSIHKIDPNKMVNDLDTNDLKELYTNMLYDFKTELSADSPNKFVNDIIDDLSTSVKELVESYKLNEIKKVELYKIGNR